MTLRELEHRALAGYLGGAGLAGHFARYVVLERPEARSLAVLDGTQVVGAAVWGVPHGLYEVSSAWIFANSPRAFELLLEGSLADGAKLFNFSLQFADLAAEVSELRLSVDRVYLLRPSELRLRPEVQAMPLDRDLLGRTEIPPEMARWLGSIDEIPDGFPFAGILLDGTLVALAESAVRDGAVAAIQQVYTLPSHRGRGLGRSLAASVARELIAEGLTPSWLAAEDNKPSLALAESVGFTLESRWVYGELNKETE